LNVRAARAGVAYARLQSGWINLDSRLRGNGDVAVLKNFLKCDASKAMTIKKCLAGP